MTKTSGLHDAVLTIAGILVILLCVRYAQAIIFVGVHYFLTTRHIKWQVSTALGAKGLN